MSGKFETTLLEKLEVLKASVNAAPLPRVIEACKIMLSKIGLVMQVLHNIKLIFSDRKEMNTADLIFEPPL